jgi:ribose transport system ATP-binding protein
VTAVDSRSPLLRIADLSKAYPGVQALRGVGLDVRAGEVHALVGENGAGKSTLGRIICGLDRPDAGAMTLRGRAYAPARRADAEAAGVRMVMQELNLIPTLSIAENIFLNRLPRTAGVVRRGRLRKDAAKIMAQVGLGGLRPDTPVGDLGVGRQQMVEIAAGLSQRCEVLILDEPTAALTDAETDLLFDRIRRLRDDGVCVVYISHRMEEIRRIGDRVTVLRDGEVIGTRPTGAVSLGQIIRMMVGRAVGEVHRTGRPAQGAVVLRAVGLSRGRAVRDVSFDLRRGEILGFAGLMGSGRTETMRLIFGADRADAGRIHLYGRRRPSRIRSPRDAVRRGIALLTEDRKQQGLLLPMSVGENVTLSDLARVSRLGCVLPAAQRAAADEQIAALSIRCRSAQQTVETLSGGNQQKVVLARWLFRDCGVLIFDEPTRGIDVGAKFEIYRLLMALAGRGKGIIVVSSDLLELLAICDRIAVMSSGRLAAVFRRGEWTQDKIMAAALSAHTAAAASGA